uniref:E3 UFM1-protein ligase 1 homolog n=1 Tax=Solanum lycopersicum TaxID=4081 RepID=A0A3Q7J1S5_SOLLC
MDEELLELQRQFEFAQQVKSTVRLSDRNVVELVQKLHQLQIIDFDLLHTISGKEYITPEQLRNEIVAEINRLGRVSLIDLADSTGVDLYHVEKQAQYVVSHDSSLMLINGEIISSTYWDTAAEEINERLQECSQIAIAEIAGQLQVGSELVVSILEPRLGTLIKGRLEGGQLYTPAYVARVSAMVRGAARGIFVPMNTTALWNSLLTLLQEMDGAVGVAVDTSFFQSLFNGLVKEGEILGSLRAGVHWTPSVFAIAQKDCVDSFFSQNSFVTYQALQKLGIPQPSQFLQSRYPDGISLDSTFAHPSIIEMLDAAVEDAIERNSWIDSLSVLPASFGSQDAFKILSLCPSVQAAQKSNRALILGDTYIFSNGFVKDLFDRMEKEMETLTIPGLVGSGPVDEFRVAKDAKVGYDNSTIEVNETSSDAGISKQASEKGSKKKKGKSGGNIKMAQAETGTDNQESAPSKSKKSQRKGKVSSGSQTSESKLGARNDEDSVGGISEEWVIQKITSLNPDFEEQGLDDPEMILLPLAKHLRPLLVNSWKERKKAAFTENTQKIKKLLDNLQKKLDESFLNMQLYEKALDLFEDEPSTSVLLHKHLLRTTGTSIVDTLLLNLDMLNKLKNGVPVEPQAPESILLSPGDRSALAKSLTGSMSAKAIATVEALEGKVSYYFLSGAHRVESFMSALREVAEESGLALKKLDKKLERTLLHSYRKDLTSQVSAETDPVSLLPQVISLLYVQVHGKALQAPGRAISAAVSRLKDKLDDSAFKTLVDYQSGTVSVLALMAAATGEEEDCTSDRILSKREVLEELMPALKGLVLGTSQPQA